MGKRLSGQSFDFNIDGQLIHVEKVTLSITDNTAAAQTHGVPDGYVDGDVSAEGEIEISSKYFSILVAKARQAGSWRDIPLLDFLWYAKAGEEERKVESFGNKLIFTDIVDIDPKGGSLTTHKIKYIVTSPDFVRLDGIPILQTTLTNTLLG